MPLLYMGTMHVSNELEQIPASILPGVSLHLAKSGAPPG